MRMSSMSIGPTTLGQILPTSMGPTTLEAVASLMAPRRRMSSHSTMAHKPRAMTTRRRMSTTRRMSAAKPKTTMAARKRKTTMAARKRKTTMAARKRRPARRMSMSM